MSRPVHPIHSDPQESTRGSAVAESAMVYALLAILLATILQFAVLIHVRNTMVDAASAGARYASLANRTLDDGRDRTRQLVTSSLPNAHTATVTITSTPVAADTSLISVTITHQVPVLGFISTPMSWEVTGHAYEYS